MRLAGIPVTMFTLIGGGAGQRIESNYHVILSGRSLPERNVVNRTLSDKRVRGRVAYGFPVDRVTQLLKEAARSIGKFVSAKDPLVLFRDFGDNALVFESSSPSRGGVNREVLNPLRLQERDALLPPCGRVRAASPG